MRWFLSFSTSKRWLISYETADRSIFDESGIGYTDSHIDNRIECTELVNSGKTYVQMKSEPGGGASSPESCAETSGGPDDCAGCGRLIQVLIDILCLRINFFVLSICKLWRQCHSNCIELIPIYSRFHFRIFFSLLSLSSFSLSLFSLCLFFMKLGSILSISCWEAMACRMPSV